MKKVSIKYFVTPQLQASNSILDSTSTLVWQQVDRYVAMEFEKTITPFHAISKKIKLRNEKY